MDLLEIQAEWGRMEDDKKSYFQECYQKEKVEMGSNYRLNYKSKRKNDTNEEKTRKKSNAHKLGVEVKDDILDKKCATVDFLERLEICDQKIDELQEKKDVLSEDLSSENICNSIQQYKLKMKTEELISLKERYEQLLLQHSLCET